MKNESPIAVIPDLIISFKPFNDDLKKSLRDCFIIHGMSASNQSRNSLSETKFAALVRAMWVCAFTSAGMRMCSLRSKIGAFAYLSMTLFCGPTSMIRSFLMAIAPSSIGTDAIVTTWRAEIMRVSFTALLSQKSKGDRNYFFYDWESGLFFDDTSCSVSSISSIVLVSFTVRLGMKSFAFSQVRIGRSSDLALPDFSLVEG